MDRWRYSIHKSTNAKLASAGILRARSSQTGMVGSLPILAPLSNRRHTVTIMTLSLLRGNPLPCLHSPLPSLVLTEAIWSDQSPLFNAQTAKRIQFFSYFVNSTKVATYEWPTMRK